MTHEHHSSVPHETLEAIKAMSLDEAVAELKIVLRAAVKLEMATIPIYLYSYYSICRKPGSDAPATSSAEIEEFPAKSSLYGNLAGATVMSVAVEEMLHMSLAMNLLTSMLSEDEDLPQIFNGLMFGSGGGIVLPALHMLSPLAATTAGRPVEHISDRPLEIPLAKYSLDQLQHFMRIEYPGQEDSVAETIDLKSPDWATIGEVYDFAKALIKHGGGSGKHMPDSVFQHARGVQIGTENYSASSIDTVSSGDKTFTFVDPPVVGTNEDGAISASTVAVYENDDHHDHEGEDALFRISSAKEAVRAINTICEQGEGADYSQFVEKDEAEDSHYYKFWSLCAELDGYPANMATPPQVEGIPAPKPTANQILDLGERFVYDFPTNPKVAGYSDARSQSLAKVANGLFQYMLIMTETTLLVPEKHQKLYFNKTMHQSMIWVMDKLYQAMRYTKDSEGKIVAPTFENPFPVGTTREQAFGELQNLVDSCKILCADWTEFKSDATFYMDAIENLPDVTPFWDGDRGQTPDILPSYLKPPSQKAVKPSPDKAGAAASAQKILSPYVGTQAFPSAPPSDTALSTAAGDGNWVRHACMGLNSCKNQGRTLENNCAGQGWCSTALSYNAGDPTSPKLSDHTCHVQNDCAGQGGCGLYGTEEELNEPGGNSCQAQGSCATPINAERFITDGDERGKSVWQQARNHFENTVWKTLDASEGGKRPLPEAGSNFPEKPELFAHGPTIEWIEDSGQGMTACGASGMSGAGSCA
ncbi:ferritin-like domain-containing protein [Planktotalea sp.]|uniref:ferritin-like domain-containing protein n=1 Tax=Planktotalea sp. TaxID=2029877 RepID=UPI003D6B3AAD